jgi:hypothetical protein
MNMRKAAGAAEGRRSAIKREHVVALLTCAVLLCATGCERKEAAGTPGSPGGGMKAELQSLLNAVDVVGSRHEELDDTDVREQMAEAITRGFVHLEPGYTLPSTFGMFSDEGNAEVRAALGAFLAKASAAAHAQGLKTPAERLAAFQNPEVRSAGRGETYDWFFGHADEP